MRATLAITIATLTLGLASEPMLAQVADNSLGLRSIHMLDTLTGWTVTVGGRPPHCKRWETVDGRHTT